MKFDLPLILFDSECPLCVRFTQALKLIDRSDDLHYIDIYNYEVYEQFPDLDPEACQDVIHLVTSDKRILKGPEVIDYLMHLFPAVKKFAWLVESEQGKKAVDFFYDKVNQIRKNGKAPCTKCNKKKKRKAKAEDSDNEQSTTTIIQE